MEFKGTKGNWILNYNGSSPCQDMLQIINSEGVEVCNFGDSEPYYPTEGTEPNEYDALLISKAPEILEMLEKMILLIRNTAEYELVKEYSDAVAQAEKIIKSATELEV